LKIYLVLPDLSYSKIKALELLSRELEVNILVSYSTLKMKPKYVDWLKPLRIVSSNIMLDSGAYHLLRYGIKVNVEEYAQFALKYSSIIDHVVAPDVPEDPEKTVERTLQFAKIYKGEFIPVAQGREPREYMDTLNTITRLANGIIGVGGLDKYKRKPKKLVDIIKPLCRKAKLHLFGIGARHVGVLSKSNLLECVDSFDSVSWLYEIKYRRHSLLKPQNIVDANYKAMKIYLNRVSKHIIQHRGSWLWMRGYY